MSINLDLNKCVVIKDTKLSHFIALIALQSQVLATLHMAIISIYNDFIANSHAVWQVTDNSSIRVQINVIFGSLITLTMQIWL